MHKRKVISKAYQKLTGTSRTPLLGHVLAKAGLRAGYPHVRAARIDLQAEILRRRANRDIGIVEASLLCVAKLRLDSAAGGSSAQTQPSRLELGGLVGGVLLDVPAQGAVGGRSGKDGGGEEEEEGEGEGRHCGG